MEPSIEAMMMPEDMLEKGDIALGSKKWGRSTSFHILSGYLLFLQLAA